jgi:hypothetical protein
MLHDTFQPASAASPNRRYAVTNGTNPAIAGKSFPFPRKFVIASPPDKTSRPGDSSLLIGSPETARN